MPAITSWSHHRIVHFEQCKKRAKYMFVDKIPEPDTPLREGQTETPSNRGQRIHKEAELYVKNGGDLPAELSNFRLEFETLRELYLEGKCSVEGQWAFNDGWQPTGNFDKDTWIRMILDARVQLDTTHAVVIDYKTGKKSGNEVKHADQMSLFQLGTFMRYPELETVTVELWYLDQDDLTRQVYTRAQGLRHLKAWNRRGIAITTCEDFKPNANKYTCQWCRFGRKNGNGMCEDAPQ